MKSSLSFKIVYLIIAGICVFLFFPASLVMMLNNAYIPAAIALLIFSTLPIIVSCVLFLLEKPRAAFWVSLIAAIAISYIGVFLLFRESAIFGIGTMCRHFISLLMPLWALIYWLALNAYKKKHGKVVFAKTEKDNKEKAKSILD